MSQIEQLNRAAGADLRHDVNNHLSLMMAAIEVIRRKPEAAERMVATFQQQPHKITEALRQFSNGIRKRLRDQKGRSSPPVAFSSFGLAE